MTQDMRRLCVVCEGQTEALFVQQVLAPHLFTQGLHVYPSLLKSRPGAHGGGRVTVERLAIQIAREYHQTDRVTTLVDFYGFKDRADRTRARLEADILDAVTAHVDGFDARFVLPYVQMHEFEALLFSDIEGFQWVLEGWDETARAALQAIRASVATPEEINDTPQTAPSKRIAKVFANGEYGKTEHGPLIAAAIGLGRIRTECRQFDEWLTRLEAWGSE